MSVEFPGGASRPMSPIPGEGDGVSSAQQTKQTAPSAPTSPAARPAQKALEGMQESAKGGGAKTVQNHTKSGIFATIGRWVSSFFGGKVKATSMPSQALPHLLRSQNLGPLQGATQTAPTSVLSQPGAPSSSQSSKTGSSDPSSQTSKQPPPPSLSTPKTLFPSLSSSLQTPPPFAFRPPTSLSSPQAAASRPLPALLPGPRVEAQEIRQMEFKVEREIGELAKFVPTLMNCTDPVEMRKLIGEANTLYRQVSEGIKKLPNDKQKTLNQLLTHSLLPEQVTSGKKSLNVAAANAALRATLQKARPSKTTDAALIVAVVKHKTVNDMIRVGLRPMGDGKADAQFAEQLLRDASKDIHFGKAVNDDPSISTMRELVDGWRLVGPDTTEGMSRVELDKLTDSQNMAIRDFYGTSVKIDRYLSLIKKTVPLLQEGKILSERSLEALDGLMGAHAAMLEMRNTFEGCLTLEAQEQLSGLNVSMVTEQNGAERNRLQGLAKTVFLEGINQGKALEYLSSPEMMSALSGVASFMSSAPDIMQEVTKGLGALGPDGASKFGGTRAQTIISEAKSQNMTAVNILQLTNSLIASLNADVVGGFNNGTQELLRNLPEDHARKDGIMNNFAQLKRLLAGS